MIVSSQQDSLVMVKQVDHARLAGDFARQWGNSVFVPLSQADRVALATDLHDLGWKEPDESVLYSEATHKPMNFNGLAFTTHLGFYRRGVDYVFSEDTYAGLLVAMHWIGLYTGRLGSLPEMPGPRFGDDSQPEDLEKLVAEQMQHWAEIKRQLWRRDRPFGELEQQIWSHYELLQYWDRLSLFACLNDLGKPTDARLGRAPLSQEGERAEMRVRATGDRTIELDPYPFSRAGVEMSVQMKRIPDRPYASHEDLAGVVHSAQEEEIVFQLKPAA